jgi:HEAT repeat protein
MLGVPEAAERPAVRAAIARAMRRDPARFAVASAAFLAEKPPASASAALALAAAAAGQPRLAAAVADAHAPIAERFADRYRFALALRDAETTAETARWLEREAREAPEWMQRRAAFEALARRAPERAAALADQIARDPTPRVRAAAASVLIDAGQRSPVEALAARDPWPLVRRAAVEALAGDAAGRPALSRALDDPAPSVRRAAIEALRTQRATSLWPRVHAHLAAADESAEVRHAAIAFAQALCIRDAQATLHVLAARAGQPDAPEPEAALAVDALRALAALGGSARAQGAALVARADVRALTALWSQLPRAACPAPDK